MMRRNGAVRTIGLLVCCSILSLGIVMVAMQSRRQHSLQLSAPLSTKTGGSVATGSSVVQSTEQAKPADPWAERIVAVNGINYFADYDINDLKRPKEYHFTNESQWNMPDTSFNYHILSWQPTILYFPKLLSPAECNDFIETAKPRMFRSEVAPYKGQSQRVQDIRTSMQTWLNPSTPIQHNVEQRLASIVNNPKATMETMQILKYGLTQKYSAHNDYFDPAMYGAQSTQRYATFFLYFSNVTKGGETYFPRANGGPPVADFDDCTKGLRVRPSQGSATLFFDMRQDGSLDEYALHGGCPVVEGEKWAGTKWFRLPVAVPPA